MDEVKRIEEAVTTVYWSCGSSGCAVQHTERGTAERCPARRSILGIVRLKWRIETLEALLKQLEEKGDGSILVQEELDDAKRILRSRRGYG